MCHMHWQYVSCITASIGTITRIQTWILFWRELIDTTLQAVDLSEAWRQVWVAPTTRHMCANKLQIIYLVYWG